MNPPRQPRLTQARANEAMVVLLVSVMVLAVVFGIVVMEWA
jgi:hypothetical protein